MLARQPLHEATSMAWIKEVDAEPIAGYRLIEPLGSGGFGEVWKCEAPGGILKAIKFVFGNLNSVDEDSVKAEQESKAMERVKLIRHPFIVQNDLIKVVAGELVIVMELADKSLHDLFEDFKSKGRTGIPRDMLLGFLSDAADGLDFMSDKHGLQHLDVKPKNLFLIADRVKVADFGLVRGVERPSAHGMMGGITPVYAAPETFANKITKQSDQYSLAVVYYELLTGKKIFNGKNIRQLAMQHMTEAPDLSALPEWDRPHVLKALAKKPEDRFPSCAAFIKALIGSAVESSVTLSMPTGSRPLSASERGSFPSPKPGGMKVATPALQTAMQAARNRQPTTGSADIQKQRAAARAKHGSQPNIELGALGTLRPAILIGIGSFGRRALQHIRHRLLDRLGPLGQVPCLRYLYIDSDPNAAEKTIGGPADVSLQAEHLFHAPLQAVTAYRRRQLDDLMTWMPREKLYAIPRSLRVDGSRSLGRLAFCDHYTRFLNRMKHELTSATSNESLQQSAKASGLGVRTAEPAVYVFVSASGGTGGMVLDVGHAIRTSLNRQNYEQAPVHTFLLTGAVDDPNSPAEELANVFATLTELNHYAEGVVPFQARYGGPEGPSIESYGLPFTSTYIMPMAQRTSEAFRDCTSHLAGYVASELTTPLGAVLENYRFEPMQSGRSPFRGFGTFGVWYPRGLLLRSAARQKCIDLLREWSTMPSAMPMEADNILRTVLGDTRLTPEPVKQLIVAQSGNQPEEDPLQYLAAWLLDVEQQADSCGKIADPVGWAVGVWDAARDWLGMEPTGELDSAFRRGRLSKTLDIGLRKACELWESELSGRLRDLERMNGTRLGSAQIVIERLLDTAGGAVGTIEAQMQGLAVQREQAKVLAQEAVQAVQGGGSFSLFGGRTSKAIRTLIDRVRTFVDTRVKEDLTAATAQFYRRIYTRFEEHDRSVKSARDRLAKLADMLEMPILLAEGSKAGSSHRPEQDDSSQTTLKASNTMRVVLPRGQEHLDRSAADLLDTLPQEQHGLLESNLTATVLEPRGGLTQLCMGSADLMQQLASPLLDHATNFLGKLLPTEDVSNVEFSAARNDAAELQRRIGSYIRGAAPLTGGPIDDEKSFLVFPDTDRGRHYAELVRQQSPKVQLVPVPGQGTDLQFSRDMNGLRMADLFRLIDPCWDAYEQLARDVLTNPHSRFDVTEWLALVE